MPNSKNPLEATSGHLFLIAGGLLLLFAVNTGARIFADAGIPAIHDTVAPAGFFLGLLGLIGVYPALAEARPVVGRVAAVVAAIPLIGWFVIAVFGIGNVIGVLPGMSAVLPEAVVIIVFPATVLAYLLFGAASLSTESQTRAGLVLFVPAIPFLGLIVVVGAVGPITWGEFVIDSGHALAHLTVGLVLRTGIFPAEGVRPTPDSTP